MAGSVCQEFGVRIVFGIPSYKIELSGFVDQGLEEPPSLGFQPKK